MLKQAQELNNLMPNKIANKLNELYSPAGRSDGWCLPEWDYAAAILSA